MDINSVRLKNLDLLIADRFSSKKANFAAAIGVAPSYVSRWYSKSTEGRTMKTDTARDIEEKLSLTKNWLDQQRPDEWGLTSNEMFNFELDNSGLSFDDFCLRLSLEPGYVNEMLMHEVDLSNPDTIDFITALDIYRSNLRIALAANSEKVTTQSDEATDLIERFESLPAEKKSKLIEFLDFLESK